MSEVQETPWMFEPTNLQEEAAPFAAISPVVRAIGSAASALNRSTSEFEPRDDDYWARIIMLHTPNGPVQYYRESHTFSDTGALTVTYPKTANPVPDSLIIDTLGAEPAELHNDYPFTDAPNVERRLVSSMRLPGEDENGSHTWILHRNGAAQPWEPKISRDVILDGRLGTITVPETRSVSMEDGYLYGYVEEHPQKISLDTIHENDERFKKLALAIGRYMGGITQLTTNIYETALNEDSFAATFSLGPASPKTVARKLTRHGYADVTISERVADEYTTPGLKVVMGHKKTALGNETVAAYEGFSGFYYTRGVRKWGLLRGVVLKDVAKVSDINNVLRPLK